MAFVGLRELHYALLTKDDETGVTYSAPVRIIGAMNANVNPNSASGTLFGDDGPMETASALGEIEVTLGTTHLPLAVQAVLLGHTTSARGGIVRKSSDVAPFVAVGYKSLKSSGGYEYTWLYKGKFRTPEQARETKTDDINFQTPSIVGSFLKREFDDAWQEVVETGDEGFTPEMETAWFDAVVPAAVAPPA